MISLFWLVPLAALTSLLFALIFYLQVKEGEDGNQKMKSIGIDISHGAMSYVKQQYKVVLLVFAFLAGLFAIAGYVYHIQSGWTWIAFLSGGFFSGLCGYLGMKTATMAAPKVTQATRKSLGHGFQIALRGGAVMGLIVTGFALLDISVWFLILNYFIESEPGMKLLIITTTMLTFGMGASTQAIFARLGGGIYTKAADIASDLIGKVEFGFREDDARNPAVIADNVGDNVGDVAGMGADLYESYVGSIIATSALGAAANMMVNGQLQMKYTILPMLIASLGIVASIIGVYIIKVLDGDNMKKLVRTMNNGIVASSIIVVILSFLLTYTLGIANWISLSLCVLVGIAVGIIIGEATNYFTSHANPPVRHIAESAKVSPATVIIAGLSVGMNSTFFSVLAIVGGMGLSYWLASDGQALNIPQGLYGIGIAAVGMLSTLGLTLATDAYGPIADNAGGNAEMSGLDPEVRERTDVLDAVGNTTAAIGKGFAIGSAALTAMALLASYIEELRIALLRGGQTIMNLPGEQFVQTAQASIIEFMKYYNVNIMNINLLIGLFVGSMLVMVFSGLCMKAVGNVAETLAMEIRRQFKNPLVLSGAEKPDSNQCITITTRGAQIAMILPASLGIIAPLAVGLILGVAGIMGLLAGCFSTGLVMAVFMANAGGAWDNAKKYIESQKGGKNSLAHKAAVIGDMVGDPFKDTVGPSINILMKIVAMVSIVTAGLVA
ncbi:sodium-translocating pyrophosphatase [Candidatus Falkowbacteria bacterium]|uniref:Putative K(+)-stimulated pyrophosphate-energized sodium pump n=1 Tax=Candidatus Falkowbacteria bacterium CG10_big_fil_rev_8_21_14_0_10_37_18 TaxID=1974562 RepID=A0A2H0V9V5_9BACT|nr:sodium-translocating pyrophosphatase [Candidatus Falkowbacteria bacterium]NCQ13051.1 sodium-translocating pyrophosphatase [Candidatus Falkowbacteria bacterium]OIO06474.1 MAG: sodium-translocating pyrophosphatase [Candidatus Falkowbacteria bacterium CG1_02_37_21]PIR95851.1 MAG: sodium-translocating pyrophosphatase [Candidatus Falkowbacteria bacterium CG10_big_fil_rev_8_21_14_0_10_37_18]